MTEWNDNKKERKNVQVFTVAKMTIRSSFFFTPFLLFEGQFPCLFCTIRTHANTHIAHTRTHSHTHSTHTHTHTHNSNSNNTYVHTRSFYSQFPFSLSSFFRLLHCKIACFFTPFLFLWESFHCIVCCSLPLS